LTASREQRCIPDARIEEAVRRKEGGMKALCLSFTKYLRLAATVAAVVTLTLLASGGEAKLEDRTAEANLAAIDLQTSNPTYSDEFNDPNLDPKFFFDNPAPNPGGQSYSLTANPGFLRMTTTGPTDLVGNNNSSPKILESAPPGDFQIVSRVLASPDVIFEHAGIIVMQDSTHWIRLIRDSNQDSVYLQEGPTHGIAYIPFSGGDVTLRLTRTGSNYEAAFSVDGVSFTPVGTTVNPLTPTHIGLTIASTPPGNVFSADFDYFRVSTGGTAVGGIAELPPLAGASAEEARTLAESSGWSSANYAALAGGLAAAVAAIGVGGWYVRRRWIR
jgi:regulation of enolase protein 1 (concanavalin A-like superfamily)